MTRVSIFFFFIFSYVGSFVLFGQSRTDSSTHRYDTINSLENSATHWPPASSIELTKARNPENVWWMPVAMLMLIVGFAVARNAYSREFFQLATIFKRASVSQQEYREYQTQTGFGRTFLNILFLVAISFWIFFLTKLFGIQSGFPDEIIIPLIAGALCTLFLLNYSLLRLTGSLFAIRKEVELYLYTSLQLSRVFGIILIPLILIVAFADEKLGLAMIWLTIICFGSFLIYRYIRGYLIGRQVLRQNRFHFLLYICALEFAPVIVLVKIFLNWRMPT